MRVKITTEAVLMSELVPPDWYPCEVSRIDHDVDKNKKDLDIYWLRVLDGPYKGKEFRNQVSETGVGFAIPFFGALLGRVFKKDDKDLPEFDADEMKGKRCMVKTKRGEYNGKPQDQLEDFRPFVSKKETVNA